MRASAGTRLPIRRSVARRGACADAFTLLELVVVVTIIGLMATISLPALKSARKGNTMVSAGRQLVDDLALARARAISERTVVHVFFVPPEIRIMAFNGQNERDITAVSNLLATPFLSYALFAERTVGDQPGRPQYRYLTSWRSLPSGVFIAQTKYQEAVDDATLWSNAYERTNRPFEFVQASDFSAGLLPFPTIGNDGRPTVGGQPARIPHIAFDPQGRLIDKKGIPRIGPDKSEVIPLSRGSIFVSRDDNGVLLDVDVKESPPGNALDSFHHVIIDGLTGRARVETPVIAP